jgi:hypothetical protein
MICRITFCGRFQFRPQTNQPIDLSVCGIALAAPRRVVDGTFSRLAFPSQQFVAPFRGPVQHAVRDVDELRHEAPPATNVLPQAISRREWRGCDHDRRLVGEPRRSTAKTLNT